MKRTFRNLFMWVVGALLLCPNSALADTNDVANEDVMHAVGVLKGIYDDYSKEVAMSKLQGIAETDSVPYAMNVLGLLYMNGIGTKKDAGKAVYWLNRAGEHGFGDAYHNLGMIYKQGKCGIDQDFAASYEAFNKGAVCGSSVCRYDAGFMLYKGLGCDQDYGKSMEMFQAASDSGNIYATYMLGLCYRNGYGTNQDEEKGLELLNKSADLGYSAAIEELTRPYPENCFTDIYVSDSLSDVIPASMPEILADVNDTTLLKGIYNGYLVMYDWSGQHVLGEKPVTMTLGRVGNEVSGIIVLGDDSIPFVADITAEGSLKFKDSYVSLHERYTFNGNVRYKLCQAALDIWNDEIRGNFSLYSLEQREPERPMYLELYREDSNSMKNSEKSGYINISQNPFDTDFNVHFELNETANATARIFNKYGMIVWQQSLGTQEAGRHSLRLQPNIQSGFYVLNIAAGKQVLRAKFVKKGGE